MVLLALLRAGHTPLLEAYANLLDSSAGPLCPIVKRRTLVAEVPKARCS